jgi:hypothetical protein
MPDFNVRSDSVNVEQIMEQIRARIREKRGADYTEQQIQELAAVKLEKFLDPRGVRSDLFEQFRRAKPPYSPPELPNYAFEDDTLFESHRAPLRLMRRLLQPLLKLFFNPNPLIQALHIQSRLNTMYAEREAKREAARHELDQLHFEVTHNLVVETTRLGIEVKNLKMRVESLTSRLEFNERRARALESVVVYKPAPEDRREPAPMREERAVESAPPVREASRPLPPAASGSPTPIPTPTPTPTPTEGPGQRSRRRRRRRGRRGTGSAAAIMNPTESGPSAGAPSASQGPREPGASEGLGGSDQTEFSTSESEPFDGPETDDSEPSDNEQ